jgi:cytochrome c-type biogenesis protein CcmE
MNERWFGPVIAILALGLAGGALWFVGSGMGGLSENLVYYWSPTELVQAGSKAHAATIRLGGLVEPGSMDWDPGKQRLAFRVTDGANTVPVSCTGAPPQMFREGIGVVVEGEFSHEGVFHTDRVMVKHSNEYRAPEDGEHPEQVFKTLVEEDS